MPGDIEVDQRGDAGRALGQGLHPTPDVVYHGGDREEPVPTQRQRLPPSKKKFTSSD